MLIHLGVACGTDYVCPTGTAGDPCRITTTAGSQPAIPTSRTDVGVDDDVDIVEPQPDTASETDTILDTNDGSDANDVADTAIEDTSDDALDATEGADTQTPADDTDDSDGAQGDSAAHRRRPAAEQGSDAIVAMCAAVDPRVDGPLDTAA